MPKEQFRFIIGSYFLVVLECFGYFSVVVSNYVQNNSFPNQFLLSTLTDQEYIKNEREMGLKILSIFNQCLLETDKTLVVEGNIRNTIMNIFHESESISIMINENIRFDSDTEYTVALQSRQLYQSQYYFRFQRKVQSILISATSQPILQNILLRLKNTRWWNSNAYFIFIADFRSSHEDTCKSAFAFMKTAWLYGLLSSLLLCWDNHEQPTLYTYNPFGVHTTESWYKVGEYNGRLNHPWVLFQRALLIGEKTICDDLFFDKIKNLNGYPVRINVLTIEPTMIIDQNKTDLEKYSGVDGLIMRVVSNSLNISLIEVPYTGSDPIGYADADGIYRGMMGDISTGRIDIGFNSRYMVLFWRLEGTYPHGMAKICFMTGVKSNVFQWPCLIYIFDVWVILGLFAVVILCTVVFGKNNNHGYISGFLNVLRMLLATAMIRPPELFGTRTLHYTVLILFLVTNSLFQGRLIAILTKPVVHNIETMDELEKSGYIVNMYSPFMQFVQNPRILKQTQQMTSTECLERANLGHPVACFKDCLVLLLMTKRYSNLHVAKEPLFSYYSQFVAKPDWPVMPKLNLIIQRLAEAGLPSFWRAAFMKTLRKHGRSESAVSDGHFQNLSLRALQFTFHVLFFGLMCGVLALLVELIIGCLRNRTRNNKD